MLSSFLLVYFEACNAIEASHKGDYFVRLCIRKV